MKKYLIKVWHAFLFMIIWIGIPMFIADYTENNLWHMLFFFTWVVAVLIVSYLMDDPEDNNHKKKN